MLVHTNCILATVLDFADDGLTILILLRMLGLHLGADSQQSLDLVITDNSTAQAKLKHNLESKEKESKLRV